MNEYKIPYPFPRTLNVRLWEEYLGRKISDDEYSLIESIRDERNYNRDLDKLFELISKKGFYIPKLTSRNGNCLFESLNILGLCDNQDNFRKFLAHMMYIYKDYKNFFGYDVRTLEEMFNDTNEVDYVLCNEELIVYKYTYETMCQDFASGFSWTRLPTQLIIQFISVLMNVSFEIFSNMSDYVNILNANLPHSISHIIYLGHLGEKHYVPLKIKIGNPNEEICPKYNTTKKAFIEWALVMERSINHNFINDNSKTDKNEVKTQVNHNTESYVEITNPLNGLENRVDYE